MSKNITYLQNQLSHFAQNLSIYIDECYNITVSDGIRSVVLNLTPAPKALFITLLLYGAQSFSELKKSNAYAALYAAIKHKGEKLGRADRSFLDKHHERVEEGNVKVNETRINDCIEETFDNPLLVELLSVTPYTKDNMNGRCVPFAVMNGDIDLANQAIAQIA